MRFLFHASLAVALAACSQSSPGTTSATNASAPSEAAAEQQAQAREGRPFAVQPVADFGAPWAMDFLPGSGLPLTNAALVTEKTGELWLVDVATGARQRVAGVPDVKVAGQGGLGDVVAHPEFAANQRVYLSFVEPGPNGTSGAAVGYGRLVVGEGQPRLEDFRVIWRQTPKVTGNGHFSHRIAFAPDGTMFVSSGERQKGEPAQDLGSDLGKILHLTAEGEPVPGNPWASRGGRAAMYWSIGHRNVLGLAFAPDGRLWASEMGPQGGDEINLIQRGNNYGWPVVSNGSEYGGAPIPDHDTRPQFAEPKVWWNPSVSPAGMIVYSGDKFPQWQGDLLVGALSGQALLHVNVEGDRAAKAHRWDMDARIREVAQGPNGFVYLLEDGPSGGRLLKLVPAHP